MKQPARLKTFLAGLLAVAGMAAQAGDLRYAIWDKNQLPAIRTIIQQFEKANPGIHVNVELIPDSASNSQYWLKMEAAVTGGVAPDVMWMNMVNVQNYARNKAIIPLDDYIAKSGLKLEDFVPASVKSFNYQGRQYGLPRDIDSVAVWYNKKLFTEAGVAVPGNNWKWDDMTAAAQKLQQKHGRKVYPIFMDLLGNGQETYYNIIPSNGGNILSADRTRSGMAEPQSVDALRKLQALMGKGLIANVLQIGGVQGADLFQSGRVGMLYAGSWQAKPLTDNPALKDQIGVVQMPALAKSVSVAHSLANVITQSSKNKDEAWKFVSFMAGDWAQRQLASTRTVIPARLSAQADWVKAFPMDVSAYVNALGQSYPYPVSLYTAKWNKKLYEGLNKVWMGQDPAKVMPVVVSDVNQILASEK
ncbi:sugar ABC transporter substrate-binding protein [Burkholderiaceae bacterium DAT-1]|nr:sugar ABC transporter substrate-binding protein [Burkholderiaceae bacterium DAT-1]